MLCEKGARDKLTNIPDLRILHDELVHGDRSDPEENTSSNHRDYTRNPSENPETITVSEDENWDVCKRTRETMSEP